jgi:diadenosine tetraphosphate (Ap4A) HIT family hydrolase
MSRCIPCDRTASVDHAPLSERIYWDGVWRIAHAEHGALPGWLVLIPARHVTSLAQLSPPEAAGLGPLLAAASRGLEATTGCEKTYLALFAEREGFQHLHVHLSPRHADLPEDLRGHNVFRHLSTPAEEWVSAAEVERIAREVADRLRDTVGR